MSASSNLDPILPSSSPDDDWRFPENWSLGDLQEFLGGRSRLSLGELFARADRQPPAR